MGEIEVRRHKLPFTSVSNALIWDGALRLQTRMALIAMLSLPPDWDYSIRGMAAKLGITKDTMSKMITEMEGAGYLIRRIQPHAEGGKFAKAGYIITDVAGDFDSSPCPNFSDTVPPCPTLSYTVEPDTVNSDPDQLKTEQVITQQEPPKAPQRGASAAPSAKTRKRAAKSIPEHDPERFERFWKAYPRDEERAKAVQEWDALNATPEELDEIALGLKRALASTDWRRGIGIPHAHRWLRDRRWTEKVKDPYAMPAESQGVREGAEVYLL